MRARSLAAVAAAVGGSLRRSGGSSLEVRGVSVDGRTVAPGDLFVARDGERADGHAFVQQALEAGATGALVSRGWTAPSDRVAEHLVDVDDPGRALLDLASDERAGMAARVVGITGSTGKTCTKDFVATVVARGVRVAASVASFNNEVGLPLTILRAPADAEAVVCEMGARGRGHIRLLCEVARPDVGVVTNVGVAHLGLFGSVEALRDAKAELPESLPESGTAVLNADDPVVSGYASRTRANILTYGVHRPADVRAEGVVLDRGTGAASFRLVTPRGESDVRLPVPGEHMVWNALAAAATGQVFGISASECAEGLESANVSGGRMDVFATADGVRVVDDAYNANPTSMAAALKAARWMAGRGRCIAVLGHMAELGSIEQEEHERVGELVARLGIDELVVVGPEAERIADAAEREGIEPAHVHRAGDAEGATVLVRRIARPGDLVLVKASRVDALDRVAAALRAATGVAGAAR